MAEAIRDVAIALFFFVLTGVTIYTVPTLTQIYSDIRARELENVEIEKRLLETAEASKTVINEAAFLGVSRVLQAEHVIPKSLAGKISQESIDNIGKVSPRLGAVRQQINDKLNEGP